MRTFIRPSRMAEFVGERKNLSHLVLKRDGEVLGIAQLRIVRPTPSQIRHGLSAMGPALGAARQTAGSRSSHCTWPMRSRRNTSARGSFSCVSFPTLLQDRRAPTQFKLRSAGSRGNLVVANSTYRTFVLDLSPTLEELRKGLDTKWRNQLTALRKEQSQSRRWTWKRGIPNFLRDLFPDAKAEDV